MPYGTIYSDTVQSSTAATPPVINDGNSAQIGKFCRAYMQYNGSAASLNSTFNISSVTKNGTGSYTTVYTVNLQDGSCSAVVSAYNSAVYAASIGSTTASGISVALYNSGSSLYDSTLVTAAVFR